jgi:hypothetical protein
MAIFAEIEHVFAMVFSDLSECAMGIVNDVAGGARPLHKVKDHDRSIVNWKAFPAADLLPLFIGFRLAQFADLFGVPSFVY